MFSDTVQTNTFLTLWRDGVNIDSLTLSCHLGCPGYVLIDRCGKHFGAILNYLRDGEIALPESKRELQELLAEAEFYCIEGLIECIKQTVQHDSKPECCNFVVKSDEEAKQIIDSTSKVSDREGLTLFNNSYF